MKNSAELSDCRKYRYTLWRTWDDAKKSVMFIGLNPSTADEENDDPTLIRCMNFAKSWGYGSVCMTNLFAYRATDPNDMKGAVNPIGFNNNKWLSQMAKEVDLVIAAWGNDGSFLKRSNEVKALFPKLHCLKMNKSGEPAHPLYLQSKLKPILIDI